MSMSAARSWLDGSEPGTFQGEFVKHARGVRRRARLFWGSGIGILLVLASLTAVAPVASPSAAGTGHRHPNVLLIMADDQTYGTLDVMPAVQALQSRGTTFTQYFDSFPLCCPTRAAVLSGQYSHNNGVWDNSGIQGGYGALFHKKNTLPKWLHDAGYRTGILGKLMNGYTMARYGVPEGWDVFRVPEGQIYSYDTTDIRDETGNLTSYPGYRTDIYSQLALDVLDKLGTNKPWFLWLAPNAPHVGAPVDPDDSPELTSCSPSPVWRDYDQGATLPPSLAYNEFDTSDKPRHMRQLPPLTPEQMAAIKEEYTQQLECLRSLDSYVATVIGHLATTGQLANTDVIYLSDNGYAYGEHRVLRGKKLPYDYASHLPLVAAGPDFPQGVDASPRSSVDIAATILDLTGATPEHTIDGTSIRTPVKSSRPIIHEGRVLGHNSFHSKIRKYWGIRTPNWLYVHYRYKDWSDDYELYSRRYDPWQMDSLAYDPDYQDVAHRLARRLAGLQACDGAECP